MNLDDTIVYVSRQVSFPDQPYSQSVVRLASLLISSELSNHETVFYDWRRLIPGLVSLPDTQLKSDIDLCIRQTLKNGG